MLLLALLACTDDATTVVALGQVRPVTPTVAVAGAWSADFGKDPDADLGPLALVADGDGMALLDQENQRLLRYDADGQLLAAVPIPSRTTLDAARLGDSWALLAYDRATVSWSTQQVGSAGTLDATAAVPATLDAPSGIFADGDTVLVEQAHGRTFDVATGVSYPGRPVGDGRYVSAVKDDASTLRITWSDAMGADTRTTLLTPDRPLGNVVALDTRDGFTLVTLLLFEEGAAPGYEMLDPELRTVLLDAEGQRVDEISLPPGAATVVTRELALGADGALWRLRTDPTDGLSVEHVALVLR
jgi:hypothetical protein